MAIGRAGLESEHRRMAGLSAPSWHLAQTRWLLPFHPPWAQMTRSIGLIKKYFCIACQACGQSFKNGPYFGANTLISGGFRTFRPACQPPTKSFSINTHPGPCAPALPLAGAFDSHAPFAAHLSGGPHWPSIG